MVKISSLAFEFAISYIAFEFPFCGSATKIDPAEEDLYIYYSNSSERRLYFGEKREYGYNLNVILFNDYI